MFSRKLTLSLVISSLISFSISFIFLNTSSASTGDTWIPNYVHGGEWAAISSSSDGTKLVAVAGNGSALPVYSLDSGKSWTTSPYWAIPTSGATDVASSADGRKVVVVSYDNKMFLSTDYGATWTEKSMLGNWLAVSSSSDGTKLVAVGVNLISVSTDSGATWTTKKTGFWWRDVTSSADGTKIVAASSYGTGYLYFSSDSGNTWTTKGALLDWTSVASSSDGTKLVAAVDNGQIYVSTDFGDTWTAKDSNRRWWSLASSSDGTKLIAGVLSGQIYISTDSGNTWTAKENSRRWFVTSSADGSKLAAVDQNRGYIYVSDAATYTLMSSSATPDPVWSRAGSAPLELGVSASTSSPISISAVRFYKVDGSTQSHTANIWNSAGTKIATKSFTGETRSGWQQVVLNTPVVVNSGENFTVSVFSPEYYYPNQAFPNLTVGPVTIRNGVYNYTNSSAFPNSVHTPANSGIGSNYGIDFVFTSVDAPTNSIAPTISGSAIYGNELTASTGTWSGNPTYTYQWQSAETSGGSYSNIAFATSSTFTPNGEVVGKFLRVNITAAENGVSTSAASSPTTAITVPNPGGGIPCYQGGSCAVGDLGPGSGVVFYASNTAFACGPTLASSCNYLEAAREHWNGLSDDSASSSGYYFWDRRNPKGLIGVTAQGTAIGSGYKNTRAAVAFPLDSATRAASISDSYSVSAFGSTVDDWYLPAKDELLALYAARTSPTFSFPPGGYWSSTETDASQVGEVNFANGAWNANAATFNYAGVRPVRAFASAITVPGVPALNSATGGDRQITLVFSPGSTGGSAITNYKYSLNGGAFTSMGTTTSPYTITGVNGRETFTIRLLAVNTVGDSDSTASLSAVTTDSVQDAREADAEAARLAAQKAADAAALKAKEDAAKKAAEDKAKKDAQELAAANERARQAAEQSRLDALAREQAAQAETARLAAEQAEKDRLAAQQAALNPAQQEIVEQRSEAFNAFIAELPPIVPVEELALISNREDLPQYDPASEPEKNTAAQVAGFAAVSVLAAGGAATAMSGGMTSSSTTSSGGSSGGSSSGGSSGGGSARTASAAAVRREQESSESRSLLEEIDYLSLKRKQEKTLSKIKPGPGDNSFTWRIPYTQKWEDFIFVTSRKANRFAPIMAKLFADAAYLRAMIGSLSLITFPLAILMGLRALQDVENQALPPSWIVVATIAALGLVDAFAGLLTSFVFVAGILMAGNLTTLSEVLTVLGVTSLFFSPALVATSFRPIRRYTLNWDHRLERIGDYLIASVLTGWTLSKIIATFNVFAGVQLAIVADANKVGIAIGIFVFLRMFAEDFATYFYPQRLGKNNIEFSSPGKVQQLFSLMGKSFMFLLITQSFVGLNIQLVIGTIFFAIPILIKILFNHKLPKSKYLNYVLPKGTIRLIVMTIAGTLCANFSSQFFANPRDLLTWGFVILSVPGLIFSLLGLFADESQKIDLKSSNQGRLVYLGGAILVFFLLSQIALNKDLLDLFQGVLS